ncbi:MAG TPA: nuclear transport factor 2 family protein [Xanthomonadales bacterium]|nr:nuclear transport factor 2 family protein [Xanthomonadales bacterium]
MRKPIPSLLLALAGVACAPAVAAGDADYEALVAAERAFAAMSPQAGVSAAFRAFIAPDAIMFRPGPVRAADYYAAPATDAPILLDWAPERAEISASGDLGWTIGPALIRPKAEPEKAGGTHFFSIWQRNAAGEFRNVLDIGINHDPVPLSETVVRHAPTRRDAPPLSQAAAAVRLQELLSADRSLAAKLASTDAAAAWRAVATDDAIVLRNGSLPLMGAEATAKIGQLPATDLASIRLAAAGDLGATAGWGGDPAKPHVYQRAWRHVDGTWRVVVDLAIP